MSFGTATSPAIEPAAGAAAGVRSEKLAGAAGAGGGVGAGGALTLHLGDDTCDGPGLDGAGGRDAAARGGGGIGAVVRGAGNSGAVKARVPASSSSAAWNEKLAVPAGEGGVRGSSSSNTSSNSGSSCDDRSEERRVGKEWRSLCDWSSDVCSSDLT